MDNLKVLTSREMDGYYPEENIRQQLDLIAEKLDEEILAKQRSLDRREQEIVRLTSLLEDREAQISQLTTRLAECNKFSEGNRQLINKLLNDIERLQQDIEWYKRTYEKRSFWGMIKQKFFTKRD